MELTAKVTSPIMAKIEMVKKAIFEFEKYAGISNGKNFAIWIASSNIYLLVLTRNIQLKVHISGWN